MLRRWYSVAVFIPAVDNKSPHNNNNCSRDEACYCVTEHFMKTHTFIQTCKGLQIWACIYDAEFIAIDGTFTGLWHSRAEL